ncbi:HesA/MoeB/ThiF family protein, partial [Vibrio parahaemolyticus]|nr:HesA/MoeB/ThiF family protein [Vibrio parahaemolyticus]
MGKYDRNMNTLSKEENEGLKNFKICVVGCGGIGGYVIEMLGRLGIGYITVIDGDVFEETNLNRQILSNSQTIGKSKAQTARERMKLVNPDIYVNAVFSHLNGENGMELIKGHHLVIDALDDVETRFI